SMSALVRTRVNRSEFSRISRFISAMFATVSLNPSQIDTVQFAAVRPAERISSKTPRSHLETIRPSMTTLSRCNDMARCCYLTSCRGPAMLAVLPLSDRVRAGIVEGAIDGMPGSEGGLELLRSSGTRGVVALEENLVHVQLLRRAARRPGESLD